MVEDDFDRQSLLSDFGIYVSINDNRVLAIFDQPHKLYSDVLDLSGSYSMLICRSSDVTFVKQNDEVIVGNEVYQVSDIQPDGTGITTITLIRI
jgi:hypothetical protein